MNRSKALGAGVLVCCIVAKRTTTRSKTDSSTNSGWVKNCRTRFRPSRSISTQKFFQSVKSEFIQCGFQ